MLPTLPILHTFTEHLRPYVMVNRIVWNPVAGHWRICFAGSPASTYDRFFDLYEVNLAHNLLVNLGLQENQT